MDRIPLDAHLIEALENIASPELAAKREILNRIRGQELSAARVNPAEVADAYQVRGEGALAAGKALYGHSEFVSALRSATSHVLIGWIDCGKTTVYVVLAEGSHVPFRWMVIDHNWLKPRKLPDQGEKRHRR
jgi:hypothetical protein